ncbi:MAG TPA: hypothetical protein VMY41_06615 [Thermohalobaculum sp.]|nr:hypothetical protein [Thermohalobaculum sp.]
MARRVVHFLLHVPKCAGTTVEEHFRAELGEGFLLAPRWRNPLRAVIGNRYSMAADDPRLPQLKAVTGHSLGISLKRHFPGAEIRCSVLLRDPVGYHLSMYGYRVMRHRAGTGPKPPPFARWYLAQRRNPISRFILNHYFEQGIPALYRLSSHDRLDWLEQRLRDFWFVGSYQRADEMIAGISHDLGVAEQAERKNIGLADARAEALDQNIRERIISENALDQALWDRWATRGWKADGRSPMAPPPALPGNDRLRNLGSDIATLLWRTVIN